MKKPIMLFPIGDSGLGILELPVYIEELQWVRKKVYHVYVVFYYFLIIYYYIREPKGRYLRLSC